MNNKCTFSIYKIFLHTIILGIAASFSHFAYDLSGNSLLVGLFNPVNESVWEHLKFMFFPFLLWWIAVYLVNNKRCEIPLDTWIVSAAVSLVVAPLSVIFLFYSYTGALGMESVVIDILLVFVCYFIALWIGFHFLAYSKPNQCVVMISVIVIAVLFVAFIIFTLHPPELPIFYDTVTKTYGI